MQTNRRTLIIGAAALGLTGLGLSGPARAASFSQDVGSEPMTGLSGALEPDEEGFCATGLDLEVGAPNVNLLYTQLDEPIGIPAFGVAPADVAKYIAEGSKESFHLRSLCSQGGGRMMMLFQWGGPAGPEQYFLRQTAGQYQEMVTSASRRGLEPVYVSVDNQDGEPRFTTLLRRSSTAWEARHDIKAGELTALATAMKAKGLRVARTVPYRLGGETRFCNLYRPAGKHGWQTWVVEEADFLARHRQYEAQGYALLQAIRYMNGGKPSWAAVWQQAWQAPQDLFWGN